MDPFSSLLLQPSGSSVPPETLEMLGRQASQMFQSQGVPLNQAIAQVVANHPELGNEHVKRIVEFANTVTFQEMFQNSADKNVHFEVADPGVVLRDMQDGGSPAHDGKTLGGSDKMPFAPAQDPAVSQAFDAQFLGSDKMASLNAKEIGRSARKAVTTGARVAGASGAAYAGYRGAKRLIDGKEKTAAELQESIATDHESHANPVDDVYDTHVRLKASRAKLAESYESMNNLFSQTREDFYQKVKAEVADPDGAGLGGVIGALEKVAEKDIVAVLMEDATRRLVEEGFQSDWLNRSLIKTAGVVANFEHPLFANIDALLQLSGEMITCGHAIEELDRQIEKTAAFIKQAGSLTSKVRDIIDHKGHLPAGIRQRFPRE